MNFKKFGKIFTSKFVGIGPASYKEKNLPGRGLTKVEKHWHILRWSHNYNTYHCVTIAYNIQYSNMVYRFVA